MQEKERFAEWLEKHAAAVVDEVLKQANKQNNNDGEYRLYKGDVLINTYNCREIAVQVAKKKGYTIRHRKPGATQPEEVL